MYRAIGLLRLKNKIICVFDQEMTIRQIAAYRKMGYGVAIVPLW